MDEVIELNDKNFEDFVMKSSTPVMIDFWASWCPPCKMTEPIFKDLAGEFVGKVKFGKINVDRNPQSASRFSIAGVPTFMVIDAAKELQRRVGAQSKDQLKRMLEETLG